MTDMVKTRRKKRNKVKISNGMFFAVEPKQKRQPLQPYNSRISPNRPRSSIKKASNKSPPSRPGSSVRKFGNKKRMLVSRNFDKSSITDD